MYHMRINGNVLDHDLLVFFDGHSWWQASTGVTWGGRVLRTALGVASPAFVASRIMCRTLVSTMVEHFSAAFGTPSQLDRGLPTHPFLPMVPWAVVLWAASSKCGIQRVMEKGGACISALLDGAGNPLVLPSVDLLARGISTFSDVDIRRLKGIIDAQVESQGEDAKTNAHWPQL